jgi:hypothetical protein
LTHSKDGADKMLGYAHQAARAIHLPWKETNALVLKRGPYVIAAGLDESIASTKPFLMKGKFINLFNPDLPILRKVVVGPNTRLFLVDLSSQPRTAGMNVVAASCRVRDEQASPGRLTFSADGIAGTEAFVRIQTSHGVSKVLINGVAQPKESYSKDAGTLLIHFQNSVNPVEVEIAPET